MPIRQSLSDTVGRTPLIRLNSFSDETGCEVLGKAEFLSPGGSVKDRAALGILDAFERQGLLKPGGTPGGVSRYLKHHRPIRRTDLRDPGRKTRVPRPDRTCHAGLTLANPR